MSEVVAQTSNHIPNDKEIKIGTPSVFDGDRKKMKQFIAEVKLYLTCNQGIYDTDTKKICFALSYMKGGTAGDWKMLKIEEYENTFPTWEQFLQSLENAFSAADEAGEARTQLKLLKQTGDADEYISKFQILASKSGIKEDSALIEYFMEGLTPKIVEKMHDREKVPTTIADWYKYAAAYDNNYRRGRAIANRLRGHHDQKKKTDTGRFIPRYTPAPAKDPNAMDVDRLSTDEQKEYMKKGLCFKCGKPGHISKDCPTKAKPQQQPIKSGKDAAARIRALIKELPEDERESAYADLEKEGF